MRLERSARAGTKGFVVHMWFDFVLWELLSDAKLIWSDLHFVKIYLGVSGRAILKKGDIKVSLENDVG